MELSLKSTSLLGPFWLLVAAWFCANLPQSTYGDLLQRLEGMRHFSHQEQLAADTLSLLQGRAQPAVAKTKNDQRGKPRSHPAGAVGESLLKKLEFAASPDLTLISRTEVREDFVCFDKALPGAFSPDVPHPPPRNGVIG